MSCCKINLLLPVNSENLISSQPQITALLKRHPLTRSINLIITQGDSLNKNGKCKVKAYIPDGKKEKCLYTVFSYIYICLSTKFSKRLGLCWIYFVNYITIILVPRQKAVMSSVSKKDTFASDLSDHDYSLLEKIFHRSCPIHHSCVFLCSRVSWASFLAFPSYVPYPWLRSENILPPNNSCHIAMRNPTQREVYPVPSSNDCWASGCHSLNRGVYNNLPINLFPPETAYCSF